MVESQSAFHFFGFGELQKSLYVSYPVAAWWIGETLWRLELSFGVSRQESMPHCLVIRGQSVHQKATFWMSVSLDCYFSKYYFSESQFTKIQFPYWAIFGMTNLTNHWFIWFIKTFLLVSFPKVCSKSHGTRWWQRLWGYSIVLV